jgi:hypothetical protein
MKKSMDVNILPEEGVLVWRMILPRVVKFS